MARVNPKIGKRCPPPAWNGDVANPVEIYPL